MLFSGDILFNGAHPIVWAGPGVELDRRLRAHHRDGEVIVPGHGPLADLHAVRELKAYFEYLYAESRAATSRG